MKRLSGAWRRYLLQVGVLVGGAAALTTGGAPMVEAAPFCPPESCGLLKPLIFFVVDASSSMNEPFNNWGKTRWSAVREMIQGAVFADGVDRHFQLGLIRFGHDPDPDVPGTTIPGDISGLVDGLSLDVLPYDEVDPNHKYADCTSALAVFEALATLSPPKAQGVGAWTRGGLDFARATLEKAVADHPGEMGKRPMALVLVTDGPWTDATGTQTLGPPGANPAIAADDLWTELGVPTYVVTLGDAVAAPFADMLALAGGTGAPTAVPCDQYARDALDPVVAALQGSVTPVPCGAGFPRVMLLLDASSSMLNIMSGTQAGQQGETGWDQVRDALAGWDSMFHVVVGAPPTKLEERAFVGLTVFGHNDPAPGEQKLVVDYGPCHRTNIAWALDPGNSCVMPGCDDPWGGPPIAWTFQDGSQLLPESFSEPTISHMPRCNKTQQLPNACVGSGTYTHLGLQHVQQNLAAYKTACKQPDALHPCSDTTRFLNILVTDGLYNSTDAQVQGPLLQMYADGVTTHVIGFGDIVNSQEAIAKLENMADWGSGGLLDYHDANNQMQLQAALQAIVTAEFADIAADPCCGGLGCEYSPEPTTWEPDPLPETEGVCSPWDESSSGTTDPGTTETTGTTGATETGSSGTTGSDSTGSDSTGPSSGDSTGSTGGGGTTVDPSATGETPTTSGGGPGGSSSGDTSDADATTDAVDGGGDGCGCVQHGGPGEPVWLGIGLLALARRRPRR